MKGNSLVNMKHTLLLFSIILVSITLNYCVHDQTALTTTTFLYVFYVIVPILVIFLFALKNGNVLSNTFNISLVIGLLMFALFYNFVYSNLTDNMVLVLGYISYFIIFVIVLLGLAIFQKFFANNIMRYGGTPKFVLSFIFFIPCLLNNFILSLKNDLITTPTLTYFLLYLEIVLILVYFAIKLLLNVKMISDEVFIIKGKYFLDTKTVVHLNNIVSLQEDDKNKDDLLQTATPLSYAISLWIQINQPELNDTVFPILLYGDLSNPKPQITYQNDGIGGNKILKIDLSGTNDKTTTIKVNIQHQKWNHIVFNYDGSTVDVFFNGLIYKTMNLSNNIPIHSISDTITIGSNDFTLNGALADITYHTSPLSAYQILAKYRLGINTMNL